MITKYKKKIIKILKSNKNTILLKYAIDLDSEILNWNDSHARVSISLANIEIACSEYFSGKTTISFWLRCDILGILDILKEYDDCPLLTVGNGALIQFNSFEKFDKAFSHIVRIL